MFIQSSIQRSYNCPFDACTTIESTLVQPSIWCLYNHRFNAYTNVDLTFVQPSIQRLHNCQINACATVDLMLDFTLWYTFCFERGYISYLASLHHIQVFHVAILYVNTSFFRQLESLVKLYSEANLDCCNIQDRSLCDNS